ncbi:UNVERIFIED_CONTAM: hypothetical protein FKN15_027806 [Acipenser sinensis]
MCARRQPFPTQLLRRAEGSASVLRSHDRASFFQTQELQSREDYSIRTPPSHLDTDSPQDLIQPRKVTHPVLESQRHQDLHRELVLSCKRGLLPENKPELQRVLEQRKLEQLREQEEVQRPKSDLEQELKKRQQKLELHEQEQMKPKADEEDVPEFVKVKENLRRLKLNGE